MQLSLSGVREGQAEFVTPMLRKDVILDTSATFGQAFAIIDNGRGHREPARIQCAHSLSFETYRKLRNTPLREVTHPEPNFGDEHPDAPREMMWQKARQQPPTKDRQKRLRDLESLIVTKQTAERGGKRSGDLF
jgi:hypothetical protein